MQENRPPKPEKFGLNPQTSLSNATDHLAKLTAYGEKKALILFWTITIFVCAIQRVTFGEVNFITYLAFVIWTCYYLSDFKKDITKNYVNHHGAQYLSFCLAYRDWEDSNLEKGLNYWRNKKGVDFEKAVAKFFERRGWSANLTPATGDGGVDVILSRGSVVFWCQCKGHSKAISVSEVRRMAGVALKSNGIARPVLIATNGFTRPAIDEAYLLNVLCLDAIKLCQLSHKNDIYSLD